MSKRWTASKWQCLHAVWWSYFGTLKMEPYLPWRFMSTWTTKGCCQSLIRTTFDDEDVLFWLDMKISQNQEKEKLVSNLTKFLLAVIIQLISNWLMCKSWFKSFLSASCKFLPLMHLFGHDFEGDSNNNCYLVIK